ncbi:MAG: ABC-2 family transporter protein [Oscillospiraceae bacterium]|nr:ABC-2 family transporter protein [Oscillospiraceae bacterium]
MRKDKIKKDKHRIKRRGLFYYLRIYGKILAQDLKSKMSYRADFIISIIGMVFVNLSGFVSFWIIFKNFPTIMGWDYNEMLFLYGFSLIALTPMQCLFDNNWNLRTHVYNGDFIKYCFKPINIFFYFMSEVFDIKGLGQLAFGITALVIAWKSLALPVSGLIIFKLVIGLISASLFMCAVINFSAAACFFDKGGSGFIMVLAARFKDYARYPITIFRGAARIIFTFVIPIAFMAYYPSLEFLSDKEPVFLTYFTPIYGVVFFYLSYKFWMLGAKKYNGTGS